MTMVLPYLHHQGGRADVLVLRALVQRLAAAGHRLAVGCCRGDEQLLQGLGPLVTVVPGPLANTPHGAPLDLACLCPPGATPLEVWSGRVPELPTWQWPDVVAGFRLQCRRCLVELPFADDVVPMLDFAPDDVEVPQLRRPAIWLDTARTVDAACWFGWDLERLARVLPDHDLLCTAPPPPAPNLIDVSGLSFAQRSRLSEQCALLAGSTLDPSIATFTRRNRGKPRAQCGYDARVQPPFWDWPGNPTEVLGSMDELVDFLLANVGALPARTAAEVPA